MSTRQWHTQSIEQIFLELKSSKQGLTMEEAESRLLREGPNELPKEHTISLWTILSRQILSPLILILCVATVISFFLGDFVDAGVILAAILLNTLIGFVQEWKANQALLALQSMVEPRASVYRDRELIEIFSHKLVVGDVLRLQTGDRVSADARVCESSDLEVNEAALTGESISIDKQISVLEAGVMLAERTNMVFAGTLVVSGHGLAIVTAVGAKTEFGKIAGLLSDTRETNTPLQQELITFSRWIAWIALVVIGAIFLFGIFAGKGIAEMFPLSVALAVAMIPEGLLVSVTIILAIGMQRILKRRSIARRLIAVETLGSVSVICSDKTGTITEGNMRTIGAYTFEKNYLIGDVDQDGLFRHLFEAGMLCNDAEKINVDDQTKQVKGSPTDVAIFDAAEIFGINDAQIRSRHSRVGEITFDSSRKYSVTRHRWDHATRLFIKGAPERVLPFLEHVCVNGKIKPFHEHAKKQFEKRLRELTSKGLRAIAVAYRETSETATHVKEDDLHGFVFLGFFGLRDPIRKEARAHILAARAARVKTVMLTGDHPETARIIGKEVGLLVGEGGIVTGTELDTWSDDELKKRVEHIYIFARVEPRHKIRIVQAFQSNGEVVAMTGDGVNDAPALKSADVGVALGSGTEVAKQVADLVLIDNNLGTITSAIEEGRVIFDNIRKVTSYLMAGSFTEVILIGGSLLIGLPLPLFPSQILWINLVADTWAAVGLTFEPGEKDVMRQPPRPRHESILGAPTIRLTLMIGIVTNIVLFCLFLWLLWTGVDPIKIRSLLFAAVGLDTLAYVFNVKSFRRSLFQTNLFSNPWLIGCVGIGVLLMILALEVPFFQSIFSIIPLSLSDWGLLLMIGVVKVILIESVKMMYGFRPAHPVDVSS